MHDEWHSVAQIDDLTDDEPVACKIGGVQIALYMLEGAIYATSNICTHAFALLSDGMIEDDCIECPLHNARFDIKTGKAMTSPAEVDLQTYETRVEDRTVLVRIPSGEISD
jgi:3-phenylpropionate/trans-cinnamate dioxygenase ferredoxin component